jgi:hypothetical protein
VYEPQAALEDRIAQNNDLDPVVLSDLQAMLNEHHQYVAMYKHAFEILRQHENMEEVEVQLRLTPQLDRRHYNLPTANEVAVILPGTLVHTQRIWFFQRSWLLWKMVHA